MVNRVHEMRNERDAYEQKLQYLYQDAVKLHEVIVRLDHNPEMGFDPAYMPFREEERKEKSNELST